MKYEDDKKRCERIGEELKKKLQQSTIEEISENFATEIGVKTPTARVIITNYRKGYMVLQVSSEALFRFNRFNQSHHLERLAIFYEVLGIDKDDQIIALTKEVNPHFVYPPERKYAEEKNYKCTIASVEFSQDGLFLNPEQLKKLERIALNYALMNRRNS
ncbi:hypothetical protein J4221_01195 [Candidatus Pacearchaeota archaeon]|nr:hypothetical protein [Candidatus Pacearchaeota archaeon]